ncbi:single-stranded DNA-binding protein [Acidaminococcus intestini]|uniref:single-stranded DNA-binding protein n=1 Tax=Acidaminococcus intestini TaxID=187327 RepID=UPI0027B9CFFB|nr:single-stranded DNA-binding protein [Acidaminococcus intestini]
MNRIMLLGRLTKDPEIRKTPADKSVCTFTLAVDRPFMGRDEKKEADFINIVAWGKTADLCSTYLGKGERALVEGRLQIRSYDGRDGQKRWITEVIADRVEFIDRKKDSSPKGGQQKEAGPMGSFGTEMQFDEEIPF